jgi:hypothetical protein
LRQWRLRIPEWVVPRTNFTIISCIKGSVSMPVGGWTFLRVHYFTGVDSVDILWAFPCRFSKHFYHLKCPCFSVLATRRSYKNDT